ncbi:transcriptional regulator [Spirochaetia bacterium]|nr:transcriptional regulator [Spirochaetia bacterium]
MNDIPPVDAVVDVTDVVCPVTFVKALVALEALKDGQVLEVKLNAGEPLQNVPKGLTDEGHRVIRTLENADGTYSLTVIKAGQPAGAPS